MLPLNHRCFDDNVNVNVHIPIKNFINLLLSARSFKHMITNYTLQLFYTDYVAAVIATLLVVIHVFTLTLLVILKSYIQASVVQW